MEFGGGGGDYRRCLLYSRRRGRLQRIRRVPLSYPVLIASQQRLRRAARPRRSAVRRRRVVRVAAIVHRMPVHLGPVVARVRAGYGRGSRVEAARVHVGYGVSEWTAGTPNTRAGSTQRRERVPGIGRQTSRLRSLVASMQWNHAERCHPRRDRAVRTGLSRPRALQPGIRVVAVFARHVGQESWFRCCLVMLGWTRQRTSASAVGVDMRKGGSGPGTGR